MISDASNADLQGCRLRGVQGLFSQLSCRGQPANIFSYRGVRGLFSRARRCDRAALSGRTGSMLSVAGQETAVC